MVLFAIEILVTLELYTFGLRVGVKRKVCALSEVHSTNIVRQPRRLREAEC